MTDAELTARFPAHCILEDLQSSGGLTLATPDDVSKFEAILKYELEVSLNDEPSLVPPGRTLAETLERGGRNVIREVWASSFGETRSITNRLLQRRMLQLSQQ